MADRKAVENSAVNPDRDTIVTNVIGGGIVSLARVACDRQGFMPQPDQEEALFIHYHVNSASSSVSVDGADHAPLVTSSGDITVKDLRRRLRGTILTPFDVVAFHIPKH